MKNLLFFSSNQNKIKEINYLFKSIDLKILSLNDFQKIAEPNEKYSGFAENAKTFVSDKFDAAQQKMKNAKESVKRKMLDAAALARDVGTKAKEALSGAWDAV